ncbi:hypothetical protein CKO13_03970 [Halorhodospira neutriphila]|uniref:Uncharacterized protein n=1 Tax=Halorhodospira neutriphila TaxID=168379 RepID=A0ABS1E5U8_9GAMM|nr:hypothetical protein [Halorhodospira neutriphila]
MSRLFDELERLSTVEVEFSLVEALPGLPLPVFVSTWESMPPLTSPSLLALFRGLAIALLLTARARTSVLASVVFLIMIIPHLLTA